MLPPSSRYDKMEVADPSEMLMNSYQSTWRHMQEDAILFFSRCLENLRTQIVLCVLVSMDSLFRWYAELRHTALYTCPIKYVGYLRESKGEKSE